MCNCGVFSFGPNEGITLVPILVAWRIKSMYQTVTSPIFNRPTAIAVAALPQPQQLHAALDLTILLTIGGFLLLLVGLGCLSFARRKRQGPAVAFCCLLPVLTGLVLASIPALTAWFSRREQKAAANAYLTYAAAMDDAVVEQVYHAAAAYNLALAEGREVECPALPEADAVIAVLELPSIGQTLPVFFGVETDVLRHGAGLLPGSSLHIGGAGTHTVFLGCSGLLQAELFTDLDALREGDCFYIHILGRTLTYQVDLVQTAGTSEISFPMIPGVDQVTLVTSYTDDAYFVVHSVNINTP